MHKHLLLAALLLLTVFTVAAQQPDTTAADILKAKIDTVISTRRDTDVSRSFKPKPHKDKVYYPDSTHSPHTAVIRSLIIPGLGQIYNHQWWKVPVIYGGLSLLGVAIVYNNTYYNEFLALSKYRERGHNPTKGDAYYQEELDYQNQQTQALYDATDGYRRDRDLSILGVLAAWGINAVDAYIDAKFMHSYSVDNNLSMRITPGLLNQPVYAQNSLGSFIPAINLTFTIR